MKAKKFPKIASKLCLLEAVSGGWRRPSRHPLSISGGGDATPWAFKKNRRDMIYMRCKKVLNVSKMAKKK